MGLLIPEDTLADIASWLPKKDLIALRAVSGLGRDAVTVAVRSRPAHQVFNPRRTKRPFYSQADPTDFLPARAIDAIGRVFGPTYRELRVYSASADMLTACTAFAANAHGALETIEIRANLSVEALLQICKTSPRLTKLSVRSYEAHGNPIPSADYSAIAISLTLLCPLLSDVHFPSGTGRSSSRSPMETFAKHFPKLKTLSLSTGYVQHVPTAFDQIEAAATQCVEATVCDLNACIVHPNLVECLLRTPLSTRLTRLRLSEATILPKTLIDAARGFVCLRALHLPDDFDEGRRFYKSLAQARPEITRLYCGYGNTADDACLRRICKLFRLETLVIVAMDSLTEDAVPMILETPCRQSLREFGISYVGAARLPAIHALVAGCPLLSRLDWEDDEPTPPSEYAFEDAIGSLLVSRGGGWGRIE